MGLTPLTTVAVLCWNQGRYVEQCLESINVSVDSSERHVVILDNGSTDDSAERIRSFLKSQRRDWEFIPSPRNLGIPRALNVMLQRSDSEFFSAIAADDFVDEQRYSLQEAALSNYGKQVVMVGGRRIRTDSSGTPFATDLAKPPQPAPGVYTARERWFSATALNHYRGLLTAPTQMWRRRAIVAIGGYDERFAVEDVPLELKVAVLLDGRFETVVDAITYYRQHSSSATRSLSARRNAQMWRVLLDELPLTETEREPLRLKCRYLEQRAELDDALLLLANRRSGARRSLLRQAARYGLPVRSRLNASFLALLPWGPSLATNRYRAPHPAVGDS